jgi:hypothetical protein
MHFFHSKTADINMEYIFYMQECEFKVHLYASQYNPHTKKGKCSTYRSIGICATAHLVLALIKPEFSFHLHPNRLALPVPPRWQ